MGSLGPDGGEGEEGNILFPDSLDSSCGVEGCGGSEHATCSPVVMTVGPGSGESYLPEARPSLIVSLRLLLEYPTAPATSATSLAVPLFLYLKLFRTCSS